MALTKTDAIRRIQAMRAKRDDPATPQPERDVCDTLITRLKAKYNITDTDTDTEANNKSEPYFTYEGFRARGPSGSVFYDFIENLRKAAEHRTGEGASFRNKARPSDFENDPQFRGYAHEKSPYESRYGPNGAWGTTENITVEDIVNQAKKAAAQENTTTDNKPPEQEIPKCKCKYCRARQGHMRGVLNTTMPILTEIEKKKILIDFLIENNQNFGWITNLAQGLFTNKPLEFPNPVGTTECTNLKYKQK